MFDVLALKLVHYILAFGVFVRQWIFRVPALVNKKPSAGVQSDARNFDKLPLHLSLVILEDDFSYKDIANAIIWSSVMGISYISVYDTNGVLKRNRNILQDAIMTGQKESSDTEQCDKEIRLHSTLERDMTATTGAHVDVCLLSLVDGRQSMVDLTKKLCKRVKAKQFRPSDINTQSIDALIQERLWFPDPDLVIKFGLIDSLLGYLPWQIRLTEIMSYPSHIGLDYKDFRSALLEYGSTHQRFGK